MFNAIVHVALWAIGALALGVALGVGACAFCFGAIVDRVLRGPADDHTWTGL